MTGQGRTGSEGDRGRCNEVTRKSEGRVILYIGVSRLEVDVISEVDFITMVLSL